MSALPGGNGVLELTALTLEKRAAGTAVYAALENRGDRPACSAAFAIELFDRSGQSLAAGIGALLSARFYRLTDGTNALAACVAPGEVSMTAVVDLPSDLAVDAVDSIVYRCPYFALDVATTAGLEIEGVEMVMSPGRRAYRGTLANELDVAVQRPSVSVFPTTRAGRPLGVAVAVASDQVEVPPGGAWSFETEATAVAGTELAAFPAGALAEQP